LGVPPISNVGNISQIGMIIYLLRLSEAAAKTVTNLLILALSVLCVRAFLTYERFDLLICITDMKSFSPQLKIPNKDFSIFLLAYPAASSGECARGDSIQDDNSYLI